MPTSNDFAPIDDRVRSLVSRLRAAPALLEQAKTNLVDPSRYHIETAIEAGTGMRAYLGTTVPEFPNMFLLAGPNTGIGHTSLVYMIEAQLAYVADAITRMRARGVASFDVREDVAEHFNEEVQRKAAHTVWNTGGCASWYLDAEGRNTTLWPDQSYRFRRRTRRFDPRSYSFKR